jgi:predicted nucleic acid-binding Zn ribbon protein
MGRRFVPRPKCLVCSLACAQRGRLYCSRKCRGLADRGKARPDAVGNKWALKVDGETKWAHYKRMQTLCHPGPCVQCGAEKAVIHHKDHNPFNTTPGNLERLCRACHARHHREKRAA